MRTKLLALTAIAATIGALEARKHLHHRNANWLRNDEGVGPAHFPGTNRGEDRVIRKGAETTNAPAG